MTNLSALQKREVAGAYLRLYKATRASQGDPPGSNATLTVQAAREAHRAMTNVGIEDVLAFTRTELRSLMDEIYPKWRD